MPSRFHFIGYELEHFISTYNCGHPPERMTERGAELAIADHFLKSVSREDVMEIGAVTPYYWPHRIKDICDPQDPHSLVNIRTSMLDISFSGKTVVSISTLEHIGNGEYGPVDPILNRLAFEQVFNQSPTFLITLPGGYFKAMDLYLMALDTEALNITKTVLVRGETGNDWRQLQAPTLDDLSYGQWADSLIVLSRNTLYDTNVAASADEPERSDTLKTINKAIHAAKIGQLAETVYKEGDVPPDVEICLAGIAG